MQNHSQVTPYQYLQNSPSSQKLILNNNPPYNEHIKDILDNNYQEVQELGIFSTMESTPNLFLYKAELYQDSLAPAIENFMMQEVERFCKNNKHTFAIAYVHSCFLNFITFRKFLEKWPEHFFRRLRRVYIVDTSLVVKIIQVCSFGTFYRLCDSLFLDVAKIEDLKEVDAAVMKTLGEDPSQTLSPKSKTVENGLYGKRIEDYDLHQGKYPVIILRLLSRLLANPDDLRKQGIFRIGCNQQELKRLQEAVLKNKLPGIDQEKEIYVICNMLTRILNKLKSPLFNNAIYEHVINSQGNYTVALLRDIYAKMDFVIQKVFVLILAFLSECVIPESQYNKMPARNLGTVFAPCFIHEVKQLSDIKKFASIVELFFEHQKSVIPEAERQFALTTLKQLRINSISKFRQTV